MSDISGDEGVIFLGGLFVLFLFLTCEVQYSNTYKTLKEGN